MNNKSSGFVGAATMFVAVAVSLCLGAPARAQSTAAPDRLGDNRPVQNNGRSGELAQFDQFLDSHPEIAEQLRRDPSLANDRGFVQNHPALRSYLDSNPGVRDQLRQDPNVFMRQENRFDSRQDSQEDRGSSREDLAEFDRFLDGHREIAEQVRKNPSLVDNREFVQNHPALQSYLQSNPGVRDQLRQDPNAFIRDENRFDRPEDARMRDSSHDRMANFGEFLGGHDRIKQDMYKDPTLVKNREYVENHRDLNDYLNAHPDVRQDWTANPHEFVKGVQQFTNGTNPNGGPTGTSPNPAPVQNPVQNNPNKPKQ